jgi:hypothetical protein
VYVAAALLASGCSSTRPSIEEGIEEGSREYDVGRYDLKGEFDWNRNSLLASVDITLTLTEGGVRAIELDSAVAVSAVRVAGTGAVPFSMDAEHERLEVSLKDVPAIADGATLSLEIDYEASPRDALRAIPARKGDPLDVRAVFTQSEPLGAAQWMPCNNTTADRAIFSVEMHMGRAESMIANGDLVFDAEGDASGRRMRYETGYSLPPYLMAFAISDFQVESTMKGSTPVSVWHRRGLSGSYDAMLDQLGRLIERFGTLLVPYPFEKYSLVLLPGFPVSGMENASITFQRESSSMEPGLASDFSLMAHELAHQWFGDLVTVKSWDDLWIKEGMATLLQAEGARAYMDESSKGTLNGDDFGVEAGEPIRDTSAAPDEKYTSGPYSRAAWLLTQIRSLTGEDAFWGTLRRILEEHRFGTIGTDEFLDAFAPALGPEATARAKRAVDARALPSLSVEPSPTVGARVTLHDPEGALVAPMEIAWVSADGSQRTQALTPDHEVQVSPQQSDEILILDPFDRHPDWASFLTQDESYDNYQAQVSPLRVPRTPQGITRFLEIAGIHQLTALGDHLPSVAPTQFAGFVAALDAEAAKAVAISAACVVGHDSQSSDPVLYASWTETLKNALSSPPYTFGLSSVGSYDACAGLAPPENLFSSEWAQLRTGLPSGGVENPRLVFLSKFRLPAPIALSTWSSVAMNAGSLRARRLATQHLVSYTRALEPADVPAFRTFFVDLLHATEVFEVLQMDIRGVVATMAPSASENARALDGLRKVLLKDVMQSVHMQAVCAAYRLTQGDAEAWHTFTEGSPAALLAPRVTAALADPSGCP